MLIDSHCHLDFEAFSSDRREVLCRANQEGVGAFFIPGIKANQWLTLKEMAQKNDSFRVGVGIHPFFLDEFESKDLMSLKEMAGTNWVTAIGECGIDAYLAETAESPFFSYEHQQSIFEAHIEIANHTQKPLVVHHRKSHHKILQSFKRVKPLYGGVIHAFSGSYVDAKRYIDLGFLLGCGGTITYDRGAKTKDTFKNIELEHIVLETDSPDMPLCGQQGKRNEPVNVVKVANCLAEIKNISVESVISQTTANAKQLFGFDF